MFVVFMDCTVLFFEKDEKKGSVERSLVGESSNRA